MNLSKEIEKLTESISNLELTIKHHEAKLIEIESRLEIGLKTSSEFNVRRWLPKTIPTMWKRNAKTKSKMNSKKWTPKWP